MFIILSVIFVLILAYVIFMYWKDLIRRATYVKKTLANGDVVLFGPLTKVGAQGYVDGYVKYGGFACVLTEKEFAELKDNTPFVLPTL